MLGDGAIQLANMIRCFMRNPEPNSAEVLIRACQKHLETKTNDMQEIEGHIQECQQNLLQEEQICSTGKQDLTSAIERLRGYRQNGRDRLERLRNAIDICLACEGHDSAEISETFGMCGTFSQAKFNNEVAHLQQQITESQCKYDELLTKKKAVQRQMQNLTLQREELSHHIVQVKHIKLQLETGIMQQREPQQPQQAPAELPAPLPIVVATVASAPPIVPELK